ncbi:MAG: DUF4178 domain-containing protein [Myxococcales bacterium]|nr:DUF4178 domain-containing protein [Myxococcales bacterium]
MKALLFILLGAGAAVLIGKLLTRKKDQERLRHQRQREIASGANVTNDITGVRRGGVLKLPPFGNQATGIETYVVTRHRYSDGGAPWYELVCQHGRRELLVEWFREGSRLVVTAGFEDENPTLRAIGLEEADLIRFDDDEEGSFQWDGITWHYEESGEVDYFEGDGGRAESYYSWTFANDAGDRHLSVEKWEGERTFNVYHLWLVDSSRVEVFDAGEGK